MKTEELVSIILGSCDGEKFIADQLESLLRQTHRNIEVIVSDDASSDDTADIVASFEQKDGRVRLHRNDKRMGIKANFLRASFHANGDYLMFCDQDDFWVPRKIETLLSVVKKDPECLMIYSDLEVCDESLNRLHDSFWRASKINPVRGRGDMRILLRNIIPGCSMMFKKSVLQCIKAVPDNIPFMHDHLILLISGLLGKIDFSRDRLVKYRQHERNAVGLKKSRFDENEFLDNLQAKIDYLNHFISGVPRLDLLRINKFMLTLKGATLRERTGFLSYYFALRDDRFSQKMLAILQCLVPNIYNHIKRLKHK